MDGALYAVGGYDGQAYLASVERMDPREGRWTPVTSMLGERGGHACAALGHELYAFGGYSKGALDTCEVYDSRANAWRPMPRMAESRAYGAAVAVGGEVFMVGGLLSDMQTHAPLLASYSPGTGAWRHLEVPSQANPRRSFLGACAWA